MNIDKRLFAEEYKMKLAFFTYLLLLLLMLQLEVIGPGIFFLTEDLLKEEELDLKKEQVSIKEKLLTYEIDLITEQRTVDNPLSRLVLVNKEQGLAPDFIPPDLIVVDIPFPFAENSSRKKMRWEAAWMLENLFKQAEKEGIDLVGVSGYRSYQRQEEIFKQQVLLRGVEEAKRVSAKPGHSEHQTGLAMDLSTAELNYRLSEEFAQTEAGRWLAEVAPYYGFIIRYPEDKEHITGYRYEPWHIRYVGIEEALEITKKGITLEEYLSPKLVEFSLFSDRSDFKLNYLKKELRE
ncbi:M15 family metallopeptidase [Fuchsiella alkaliacetigena]|uniref:M15 family metallopeptidase n=1 Tax=Fuchsiella alkaliacetigena TaxID=957042 RepID=UPI002009F979|nr:M15 family metallopeptidase [Fuchsiella alkaliacetigena]MCK8825845.1 M15 family metallopeptidase [Fuchsiella alkaliacetigena]